MKLCTWKIKVQIEMERRADDKKKNAEQKRGNKKLDSIDGVDGGGGVGGDGNSGNYSTGIAGRQISVR